MLKAASGDAANIYAQMKKRHFRDGINHKVVWIYMYSLHQNSWPS